ncbi:hypothetical protein [Sphingomicrobium maritimum]|uniref:hypothetical protein n=1 Tax=Sphingomicrobium maritimum TaxID=3133972 RepID=UPI003D76A37D
MFTQLNPPLPMDVEGKGPGQACGVIDYGAEHHLIWVVALDDGGEIWCTPNPKARMQTNWTMDRHRERLGSGDVAPHPAAARTRG